MFRYHLFLGWNGAFAGPYITGPCGLNSSSPELCFMARMADDAQLLLKQCGTSIHPQEARPSPTQDQTVKQVMSLVKYCSVFTGGETRADPRLVPR